MAAVTLPPRIPWRWALAVLLLDLALAVAFLGSVWADPLHRYAGAGDQPFFMSFWSLTDQAIGSLHNPFFTTLLNAPDGVNLAWNTGTPLLAVIGWPVGALLGPVAEWNVLIAAGIGLSAWTGTLAIHRFVPGRIAATVGGLPYGFSPFVTAQAHAHLHLAVVVTPPLLLILLDRVALRPRGRVWLNALLLAATVVAQFLIAEEVAVIEMFGVVITVAVLAARRLREARARLPGALRVLGLALPLVLAALALPLLTQFAGPQRPLGAVQHSGEFVSNGLNLVVPTPFQALSPGTAATAAAFSGNLFEATAYLGIPLLLLLAVLLRWHRRDLRVVAAVAVALVALVLSFGARLQVGGAAGGPPLPWGALAHLPVLENLLPVRFTLLVDLAVALALAAGLDAAVRSGGVRRLAVGLLTALVVVSWIPAPPAAVSARVPAFFAGDASLIPAGSTVLLAPVPVARELDAQLWQAYAGARFAIVGGSYLGPDSGHPRTVPELFTALRQAAHGGTPAIDARALAAMRAELRATGVSSAVLGPAPAEGSLMALLTAVCGATPSPDQGVLVWWRC